MKVIFNHRETEDLITATLDYATYLGEQARDFGGEPQIVEELTRARDTVLCVRLKMFAEGTKIDLTESEGDILRKICLKASQKHYDKANEYRGTFIDVCKAFEEVGDRYIEIAKKLAGAQ